MCHFDQISSHLDNVTKPRSFFVMYINMDYREKIALIMIFSNVNAFFRQKFRPCALQKTKIVGIIDHAPGVCVFVINFDLQRVFNFRGSSFLLLVSLEYLSRGFQGVKDSSGIIKFQELEPSNPVILEPYFNIMYVAPRPPSQSFAVTYASTHLLNVPLSHFFSASLRTGPFGDLKPRP